MYVAVQHEMLEQEAAHLRTLYQQQQLQQQQQPTPAHTRSASRDFDSQFASLSLNHKDMPSGPEQNTYHLRI